MTRRGLFQAATGALLAGAMSPARAADDTGCTLSFGTYGMKTLKTEDAVRAVARAGFDGVEITVAPGWDAAPSNMPAERRKAVRLIIEGQGLKLPSLMEHLYPAEDDAQHAADLERLRASAQLAHDLCPDAPPLIQTVLGGGEWEKVKGHFVKRLADWMRVAEEADVVFAIKPHRGGGMSRPSEAVWLIKQLGDPPHIRMVYDYSHYAFRGMPLEETIATALPYTAHIAVKDAVKKDDGKVTFQLPGESGTFDYVPLIRQFYDGGYRADFCCEVSGAVWGKEGYEPLKAAAFCYEKMAAAFDRAGVPRTGG